MTTSIDIISKKPSSISQQSSSASFAFSEVDSVATSQQSLPLSKQQEEENKWNSFGAKWLIWLAGVIFCIGGTCLLCAHDAGVADFFDHYVTDGDDNTYTLYLDGLYCVNGRCVSFEDSFQVCKSMHRLINYYRVLVILCGAIQMLFTLLMFGTLFLRMISQLGKELLGAHAAKKSIFAKVDNTLKQMSKSRLVARLLLIFGSLFMTALFVICSFLMWQCEHILYSPLCPNLPTQFNVSLSEYASFTPGRGTHLVRIGCACALTVGASFVVWVFIYICCNWNRGGEDDDLEDEEDLNPEYKEYKEKYEREEKAKQLLTQLQNKKKSKQEQQQDEDEDEEEGEGQQQQQPPNTRSTLNSVSSSSQHENATTNGGSNGGAPSILNQTFVVSASAVGGAGASNYSMKAKSKMRKGASTRNALPDSARSAGSGDSMKVVKPASTLSASSSPTDNLTHMRDSGAAPPELRRTMTPRQ
jgi:hypothetical protein